MQRFLFLLCVSASLWCSRLWAQGQNLPRIVPTVGDLLAIDPSVYAASLPVTTNTFTAYVQTTGDVAAGDGTRLWRLVLSSTAATNSLSNQTGAVMATTYGGATGRWFQVGTKAEAALTSSLANLFVSVPSGNVVAASASGPTNTGVSTAQLVAAVGASVTNSSWIIAPIGTGSSDDRVAVQAALDAAANIASRTILFPAGTNRFHPTNGVVIPDGIRLVFAPGYRFGPLAHMISNFEADEQSGRLFEVGNNVTIEGSGENHYQGRRFEAAYTNTIPVGTWRRFAAFRGRDKANVTIRRIGFLEGLDHVIYARGGSNWVVELNSFPSTAQAIRTEKCNFTTFARNNLIGMDATLDQVAPTLTVFQDSLGVRVTENNISGAIATSGGSYVLSMINCWGSPGSWVVGNYVGPMLADSTIKSAPIVFDVGSGGAVVAYNIIDGQHNGGNAIALEGQTGFFCGYNQILPPDPALFDGSVLDYGIYCRSATIHGVTKPGGVVWNNPFIQERTRTPLNSGQIVGNQIWSANIGIQANVTDADITRNRIVGCKQEGIRTEGHVNGDTTNDDFSEVNTTHRHENLRIEDNVIEFCGESGATFAGGDGVYFRRNVVRNCDQAQVGAAAVRTVAQRTGTTTSGSTATLIQASASVGSTPLGGRHLYFPSTGQIAEIESSSGSTITLRGAGVSPAPGSGVGFAVLRGHMGRFVFDDNDIFDDQSYLARTNVASLDPRQTYGPTSTNVFFLTTDSGQIFQPGRRLTLKGVLSGNTDALVEVVAPDDFNADRYWVRPISPTNGTFQTTAGTAITAGVGTISYTDGSPPNQHENRTAITGSGTSFLAFGQLKDNCWIGVGTNWMQIRKPTSATAASLLANTSPNFSGASFVISTINVVATKSQGRAYRFEHSPIKIDWGHNRCWNNEVSPTSPQGYIDLATAPDAIPRITSTSTMDLGYRMMRFALTGSTTFTDLRNAYMGAEVNIMSDGNAVLDFTAVGTKLKGSTTNITPAAGVLSRWKYYQDATSDGAWHVQVIR